MLSKSVFPILERRLQSLTDLRSVAIDENTRQSCEALYVRPLPGDWQREAQTPPPLNFLHAVHLSLKN